VIPVAPLFVWARRCVALTNKLLRTVSPTERRFSFLEKDKDPLRIRSKLADLTPWRISVRAVLTRLVVSDDIFLLGFPNSTGSWRTSRVPPLPLPALLFVAGALLLELMLPAMLSFNPFPELVASSVVDGDSPKLLKGCWLPFTLRFRDKGSVVRAFRICLGLNEA
jgi:hypothetical protein